MFMVRNSNIHNLKKIRTIWKNSQCYSKAAPYLNTYIAENDEKLAELIKQTSPKIIYNSVIESKKLLRHGHRQNAIILQKLKKQETHLRIELGQLRPLPVTLKYYMEEDSQSQSTSENQKLQGETELANDERPPNFPLEGTQKIDADFVPSPEPSHKQELVNSDLAQEASEEVKKRYEMKQDIENWMTAYDNYDDSVLIEEETGENEDLEVTNLRVNYGTPDPNSEVSKVPCGGCGALLHCKDTAIPGYIPSEIFKNHRRDGGANLQAIVCQRCHFLQHHNVALQMRVSADDYPKVLANISQRQGLVVLMVDLLDFPCSIWPGIADIFGGHGTPIVLVGNKVDLLPKDSKGYLEHIKKVLATQVKLSGFATVNIKRVVLISAKTGYGVEDLITTLGSYYRYKGDVFIVGCTNVGKSSLFNAFLQSDYCKTQAADLIQRATTSVWPGTTLNLLKFPIKRPSGYRQYLRDKRLKDVQKIQAQEAVLRREQLRNTNDPKYATLIGRIEVTKNPYEKVEERADMFSVQGHSNASGKFQMGLDETKTEFAYSKWCYDTPGVVQPDQIVHLLTAEELMMTLPKELIMPRSFCVKPGTTLFVAGLSRLDYVEGPDSVKLTVFAAKGLPITICNYENADDIYHRLLGTELFKAPSGNAERLSKWPKLELAREFSVTGIDRNKSAIDVVLSSSGWIAITGGTNRNYKFQAWTPEKRGVYLRDCLLPYAVALKGTRIPHSVAYNKHKFYTMQ